MSLEEIFKYIYDLIGTRNIVISGGLILIYFIEITPIKINPWTFIKKILTKGLTIIGDIINQNINTKIDKMNNDFDYLKTEMKKMNDKIEFVENKDDERDAVNTRNRILAFGDDLMHGILHSKDSYDQVLFDIVHYNSYCDEHQDFKNHITEHHAKLIEDRYMEHLENNDFLQ